MRREPHGKRVDDLGADVVLDVEKVAKLPVVALRPDIGTGRQLYQLNANPDLLAFALNATIHHVGGSEMFHRVGDSFG
ncbi:hypothetical protein [Paracoccus zhejiangensis]|uniref:Uncharacterized protein n=1 Tax=Paracoccus zhejiangensis TaxID=1077935 RepID=A0A2H5F5V4_9RHOB|nr:hypothetical protein [Paracoccus zhejiangensis]AUH66932.1 hypothetical protein CX676_21760 [Paracoccus zhejiangensis]